MNNTDFTEVTFRTKGMVLTVFPNHNRINLSLKYGLQTATMSIDDLMGVIEQIQMLRKETEDVRNSGD